MLHAVSEALTPRRSGIIHVRNDDGKALSRQAYHEATETAGMSVFMRQRE